MQSPLPTRSAGLQLCCLPSIPAPASSLWVCVNFLSYPKSGLHSLPFVPRPSAPREHITWTSQTESELEWVRTSQSSWSPESCDVLLATHPYVLGKCGLFPGGAEHLPQTAAAPSIANYHTSETFQQERAQLFCWGLLTRSRIPLMPQCHPQGIGT